MTSGSRRYVALSVAVILVLALTLPLSIVATSWHARWQAFRLLACARMIHPGATTESQARNTLSRFEKYLLRGQEWTSGRPAANRDSYLISNYPGWVMSIASHIPSWAQDYVLCLPYTAFSVSPRYRNGELVLLEVSESQDHRGDIHPFHAIVRILSTGSEMDEPELPDSFSGFQVSPYEEAAFDENQRQIGPSWIIREYVTLDERASPDQFDRSFRFNLGCLTSFFGCHDARKILPLHEVKAGLVFPHKQ